jgi:hypothetical protein
MTHDGTTKFYKPASPNHQVCICGAASVTMHYTTARGLCWLPAEIETQYHSAPTFVFVLQDGCITRGEDSIQYDSR